jgi:hypothetical protein
MKSIVILVMLFALFFSLALGGEIYGNIKEGKKIVGEGIRVKIVCGADIDSTVTDKYGSYSLYAEKTGECRLSMYYKGDTLSTEVHSYEDCIRYNFIIDKKDNKFSLRRK